MTAKELRTMYVSFFKERGHKEIASASLLPENDPTVLFTTAGMHPLVPYLLGEKHPAGKRLTGIQKCVRTDDIDEVGDDTHLTFFEMMGNWSLGDYFKQEAISMSYEFLTDYLHIPAERLAVTVFEGDNLVPADLEAERIWKGLGLRDEQIYRYGREENWWGPAGQTGPCGPDTEIFYDLGKPKCGLDCGPSCKCGKFVEIWNNVFMQFNQGADGGFTELTQKNIDTGMGFERVLTIFNGKNSVYETELFVPVMTKLEEILSDHGKNMPERDKRIICEHIRAVTFILGDPRKITPSNTEQGYILRRFIRRMIRLWKKADIHENHLCMLSEVIIHQYQETYPELGENRSFILEQLEKEYRLFSKTLDEGLKKTNRYLDQLGSNEVLSGELAFRLYDTYGFPIEFTSELAQERGYLVDMEGFQRKYQEHQEKSRQGAAGKFAGGLADHNEQTERLHTATHLLNGALRKVLGDQVSQRGSNITSERLRFDFSFDRKMTREELEQVARLVNEAIEKQIDVVMEELPLQEAYESGAVGVFTGKYEDIVKVYTIPGYSREICGGPHAKNTRELVSFKIVKEEASSAGVRRIKAVIGAK
ncbi:MAG: alanine--tRNA ligase [bacterium]|nr:alanine--tRNA ligase [bacterium]MCM1375545.1 alanine--tRNA ligase [Muribaculum sp.]